MCPRISVVLPIYNGAKFLEQAVDSILRQTRTDWELLLLDDGSADHSWELCCRLKERDSRIRIFRHEVNRGLAAAMNRLCNDARGEYIAVQEQDDVSVPDRLECEARVLEERAEIGVVSGIADWLDDDGLVYARFPGMLVRGEQYPQSRKEMVRLLLLEQCKVANAGCMFRRTLISEDGFQFNEAALLSIDWEFFIRAAHRTLFYGLPQTVVRMRRGKGHRSLTSNKFLMFSEAHRCLREVYSAFRQDPASPIGPWLYRRAMARQLHLEGRYWGGWRGLARLTQALVWNPLAGR